ncbi:cupin domain-containing protein [Methylomonas rhizoryzae]|uniref:cupin domain-containing protein n=1 Tax=Methylomonas rhizoryzae TaxID=2608981 RepID=UPI001231CEE2|nr:cupin domain-containing protein [Methylomonas rhizoryzae]
MNDETDSLASDDDTSQDRLNRLLLDHLSPIPMPQARKTGLRQGLLAHVAHSAARHAGLLTVRGKHGSWRCLTAGVKFKTLWDGPQGSSVLIEFAAGAGLIPHRHHWLEEGIVLRGGLQMEALELGPLDYHVSPPGSRHATIKSRQGALAYLRGTSLGDQAGVLREVLGGLLPGGEDSSDSVFMESSEDWQDLAPGVQKKVLYGDRDYQSCFYRLFAGAQLPDYSHSVDEECMVLAGEVFFGDMLLQAGDFQLAPAGRKRGDWSCDSSALLFVRGAIVDLPG